MSQDKLDLKIRKAFATQKCHSKIRGIPFLLSIAEWWNIWQLSGQYENRGPHTGRYCMSRYGDVGPYSIGNVFIQLSTKNVSDRYPDKVVKIKRTKEESDKLRGRKGRPAWNKGKTYTIKNKNEVAL